MKLLESGHSVAAVLCQNTHDPATRRGIQLARHPAERSRKGVIKTLQNKVRQMALEAAGFVLSEITRINALSVEDRLARLTSNPREGFGMLWGHPRYNPIECGWAAKEQFNELVRFATQRHPDVERDASWNTVSKAVAYAFISRFIEKNQSLTISTLSSMADSACKHVRSKLEDQVFIVPCNLWQHGEPENIPVGPVTFLRATAFFSDETIKLEVSGNATDRLSAEAVEFAKEAGWVAVVKIPHVDAEVAPLRAANAIDSAINVLRVLLGPERMRRCRRAESWGPPGKHSYFRLLSDRTLSVRFTWSGREDLVWENWSDFVFGGEREQVLMWAGAAIHGLTEPQRCLPLQQRFLDALKWYGDAVSEHSVAARIAKCVFAWERLVIATDRQLPQGVTQTQLVSERTAILCEYLHGEKGEELRKRLRELYDVRSRLAHGSQSPWDAKALQIFSMTCEVLTARALTGSLRHYLALRQGLGTDKELEDSFGKQRGRLG